MCCRATREALNNYPRFRCNPKGELQFLLNDEAPDIYPLRQSGPIIAWCVMCVRPSARHIEIIEASERSIMASGAMLFSAVPRTTTVSSLTKAMSSAKRTAASWRELAKIVSPGSPPGTVTKEQEKRRGALAALYPLPTWQVTPPGDIFRVFERGGRIVSTQFAEVGLPNPSGSIQKLEEPGRPDLKQSNRGPGTGLRVAIPVLNIHKTRLNDPLMWFMGTNDQPGDYRGSGCTGCHVIYANDREPRDSLIYAQFGRDGQSASADPTIAAKTSTHGGLVQPDSGHPLHHAFTRAIPTAQCMVCHMHQPNIFLNSYLGYTMWDYESDAPSMWPKEQKYPTAAEVRAANERNPEGAAVRGNWSDPDFLRNVYDLNPTLKDTQFADYHGHGWNFRGVFKRDREGNLLDKDGKIVWPDDPEKWRKAGEGKFVPPGTNPGKAVHLMDIHAEKGMQCADCHFAQDSHGNGLIYGEVANAVEIGCKDCHGTVDAYPTLRTSGPAARPQGNDLEILRNPDGQRRFEWARHAGGPAQADPALDRRPEARVGRSIWSRTVSTPPARMFNIKAARAKLISRTGAEDGKFRLWPRRAGKRPCARRRYDGLHLQPATSAGRVEELLAAATCRSRPTGRPRRTISRARKRATSPPTTRKSHATTCSSLAAA